MEYFFNFEKLAYVRGGRPSGCILCLLRDGSSEVEDLTVYRDDLFVVTVNLYPYNPGHLMIFPCRHIEDVRAYTEEESDRFRIVLDGILDRLDKTHHPAAYNIGYNMGRDAGASIDHLHLHVIPRYPHEIGIADLMAGKRVLVESPLDTRERLKEELQRHPLFTD